MRVTLALLVTVVAACGGDGGSTAIDAPVGGGPDGGTAFPDAAPGSADGAPLPCGDGVLPVADITGTEGIAIAADGTLYYSQSGAVGRVLPGGTPEDAWAAVGGDTVWGMALAPGDATLYVAVPSTASIVAVDTATGVATPLLESAGNPNGLVVGPDGAVYYSHFSASSGRVYRVDPATGTRTEVTSSVIVQPNGIYFASAEDLYVLSYQAGEVLHLSLDASGVETARSVALTEEAYLDGIGRDAGGRWYLTDNLNDRLLRYEADWSNADTPEVLGTGISSAASIAWGRGALSCTDVYVASGGPLGRVSAGVTGNP